MGYYVFLIEDTKTIYLIKILLISVIINLILNMLQSKSKLKIFSQILEVYSLVFISFLTINFYKDFDIHPVYLNLALMVPVYDFFVCKHNRFIKKSIFNADNSQTIFHI